MSDVRDQRLDLRAQEGSFGIELSNSDSTGVTYTRDYEFIPRAFSISTGVMPTVQGSNLSSQNMSFHANGARERDNNFLLDGVDNNDPGNGQLNIVPSVDAIQEYKIQSSTYGAGFGRAGGGVLNVQTKSGTNDFQLTLFEFLRNDIFDARNFFATEKRPYRRNQFGTVVSGPIKKDRAFFFYSFDCNEPMRVHVRRERLVGDRHLGRPLLPFGGQDYVVARVDGDRRVDVSDPDSRSLQVAEDADGLLHLARDGADGVLDALTFT